MDYEKAYKEALELARKMHTGEGVDTDGSMDIYEIMFPELRESEDERIRRWIKTFIEVRLLNAGEFEPQYRDALDWLEEQKEQKPNIELIQRSWYMEGYQDREHGMEPMYLIEHLKYKVNPNYGKPLEEPVCEELKDAAKKYAVETNPSTNLPCVFCLRDSFKAGANWQKEQNDIKATRIARKAIEWYKEEMMKGAVEGEVCIPNVWVEHNEGKELVVRAEISKELGFKFGDKVRIIVLKDENH